MSKKPKQSTATTTTSRQMDLPEWLSSGMRYASRLGNYATRNNATFAPFSQSTEQGLGQVEAMGADPMSIPGYAQAFQQYGDTLSGNFLAGGEGFNQALNAAQNRIIPGVTSAFNASGRMTGNAGQSELARQIGDSFAGLYNSERQRQLGALGMAPAMQQLAFDPANRMIGAGAMREAKQLEEQQDPINRANQYAGLLGQIAPFYAQSTGTEQRPYFTSGGGLGSVLGAGLSLAGMMSGNPMLAMGGNMAGGLLGGSGGIGNTMPGASMNTSSVLSTPFSFGM